MKKAISIFSVILVLFLAFGCNSTDDSNVSNSSDSGTETSFNFTMTSYKSQETASSSVGVQADFTADQIMTGQLTATPSGGGTAQVFDWSIYFDETTWDVQSNKTIILAPGTYDFSLLITKGSQEYAGTAAGVSISDGTFDVPMTVSPVIGDTVTDVTLVASLADFKFQYDPAELSAASLTNPQMGIIVDGGTEEVFTINPTTGISDNYVNLPEGSHTVQLKLYEASLQVGRSITAQESVIITAGLDLAMDLVALHGETTFALTEAGGDAYFDFNIPAEVVDEAGGLANLQVLFSMVGDNNPLEENVLNVVSDGSGGYEAEITLTDKQFDTITVSLTFTDTSVSEELGSCAMVTALDTTQRTLSCDVTLRRRAIFGGTLLATLGINVFNDANEPVSGATIFKNGVAIGVTNSGTFGTVGYDKTYLPAGSYQLFASKDGQCGSASIALTSLGISNVDIVMGNCQIPTDGLVAYYPFSGDAQDMSGTGNHGSVNGPVLTQDRFGNPDSAYLFDGIDDKILVNHDSSIEFGVESFTLSAWFRTSANYGSQWGMIFDKDYSYIATGLYRLHINPENNNLRFYTQYGSTANLCNLSTPMNDGSWHHVVAVRDTSVAVLKVFVDGSLDIQCTEDSIVNTASGQPLAIGGTSVSGAGWFDGEIDDARIYNRPLTDLEVLTLFAE